jgi:hypothetical protein
VQRLCTVRNERPRDLAAVAVRRTAAPILKHDPETWKPVSEKILLKQIAREG